jgi:hypothetical protein
MTAVGTASSGVEPSTSDKSARWAGIGGLAFAGLLAASTLVVSGMPDPKNATKVQAWMVKHTGLLGFSFLATMVAVVVGLCFLMWLYSYLTRGARDWIANTFLAGVFVFAMSGTIGAGLNAALSSDAKHLSTGSLQLMASLDMNLSYPMACAGLALMYLAAGFLIRRTGLLPGWLAWVSWVFAVLAISFFLGFVALFGTVLWVIVVGVTLIARGPAAG